MKNSSLEVQGLCKHFDGIAALQDVTFRISSGELVGVAGPNGAGKTTLLNVISGFLSADSGQILLDGHPLHGQAAHAVAAQGVVRSFQEVRVVRALTVLDNLLLFLPGQPNEQLPGAAFWCPADARRNADATARALPHLRSVNLDVPADSTAGHLSYGQQKLLSLACCLASGARIILLDEPVAGLSPSATEHVLSLLTSLVADGTGIMMIEHNMDAVRRVCTRMLFLDCGRVLCEGTPNQVLKDPRVLESYLG